MSGYISSLFIELIFSTARRFSVRSPGFPASDEPVPLAPDIHDLHEPAQSLPVASRDKLSQKLDNVEQNAVTTCPSVYSNLHCSQRRLVACTSGVDDDLRVGTMDDAQYQLASNGENIRAIESYEATNTYADNDSEQALTSTMTAPHSDAIVDRRRNPLRELPEDDGMTELRRRIHAIRDNDGNGMEKARLIHSLMIENYKAARANLSERQTLITQSLPSVRSRDPSVTSTSGLRHSSDTTSFDLQDQRTATPDIILYNLSPKDLEPTFAPKDIDIPLEDANQSTVGESITPNKDTDRLSDSDYSDEDILVLGCQHYKRNVKLQCYTCKKWYTCRFCHNENEDHALERPKTENMLCMLCGEPQPAAQWCKGCGESAASYFCAVCKLWDNDSSKSIYHCQDCGICRIGQGLGKDFYHCKTCCVCIPISIENTHRCIERSTQCDCPICGEYMFTSPDTVVFMRCGHSIHQKCYDQFSKNSYRCPICSKSIMNMEARFRNLDRTIEGQPMPSEFEDTRAMVYCNDCGAKSDVSYHWLGLKCDLCESYNTVQLRLFSGADVATEPELEHRTGAVPVNIPDHACESLTATSLVDETLAAADMRRRPSTAISVDRGHAPHRRRAVSPAVSNYFELSRDSTWAASIFSTHRSEGETEAEESGFWATSPLRKYSFFRKHSGLSDDGSESDSGSGTTDEVEDEDEDEDDNVLEDDDEDEIDPIEIFGHR